MQSKFRIANIVGEQYIHNYNAQGIKECVNKLDSVYVMSYHQYLSLMLAKEQSGFNEEEEQTRSKYLGEFCYVSTLEGITFDYIICDECHFFLQDSLYNSHSECIYNKIFSEHPDAVKIFLTATPMEVLPALTQTSIALSEPSIEQIYNTTGIKLEPFPKLTFYNLKHIEHQYRYNPTELDFINDLPLKIAESFDGYNENDLNPDGSSPKIRPKWLIFVANIKRGKTLCEAIKKKCNNLKIDFISSETKESTKDRHKFYDIVYNEYFEQDVLITTTVLDNGVNLSNPPVTDLALDVFDEVTSIQCCGRVRVHEAVPIINLYLQRYSPKYVSNHINECKRVIKLFERNRHYPVDIKVAEKFNVPNVWYTDSSNQPQLNKFAETKAIYNFNFFSLCNSEFESNPSVFIQQQFNWLGINKSLLSDIFDQKQEKILAFMKAHRNTLLRDLPENNPIFESDTSKSIKTFSNEFKQLYLELYGPRYEGEKTDSRSYGLDIIKDCLERVGLNNIVKIKSRYKQDTKLDHTIYNVLVFK